MRFTEALGMVANADTTLHQGESIDMLFEADAAISVGACVAYDTGNTAAKLVVTTPAAATSDHRAIGIYTGQGGTGAETTISGLKGRAAVDGDHIWVRVFGVASTIVDAVTTQIADGDILVPHLTTAGILNNSGTTLTASLVPMFTALEALATGTTAVKSVLVRCV